VRQPEEDNPPEYSVQSEHDIIREIPEDIDVTPVEPEQSFTTAPVSFGPVAGSSTFRSPSPDVRVDKGKGRAEPPPSQGEGSSSRWSEREQPPHMAMASEEWAQLRGEMEVWAGFARENQEEAVRTRQDMDRIHSRVITSYHRTSDVLDMVARMQNTMERLSVQGGGRQSPAASPRALASQALYADRGSSEGTVEYERRQSAQARLGFHHTPQFARDEEMIEEVSSPMTQVKAEWLDISFPDFASLHPGYEEGKKKKGSGTPADAG
jgi:hypothetical protein